MLSIVGCACGMDPGTETMLINAALAGVISMPFLFRDQAFKLVRRVRRKPEPAEEPCPLPAVDDEA